MSRQHISQTYSQRQARKHHEEADSEAIVNRRPFGGAEFHEDRSRRRQKSLSSNRSGYLSDLLPAGVGQEREAVLPEEGGCPGTSQVVEQITGSGRMPAMAQQ